MSSMTRVVDGLWLTVPTLLLTMLICAACQGGERKFQQNNRQGAKKMITYPIGRFAIDIPAEMELEHQGQTIRYAQVEEVVWPSKVPREQAREAEWQRRLAEIQKLRRPEGVKDVVKDLSIFSEATKWSKGILYYGDYRDDQTFYWDLLVDAGEGGVWFKIYGLSRDHMVKNLLNLDNAYDWRNPASVKLLKGDGFNTRYGAVYLPYLEQESVTARFIGYSPEVKIKIKMKETHHAEPEGHNLLGRVAAVIATGYNVGVDINRIRSRKRRVAGLDGEEEIDRMKDQYKTVLSFAWRSPGKPDSGERPEILVTMESEDGQMDEKLQAWDAVLDSMRPLK